MTRTTDQERGTGPGEGGASVEESCRPQDTQLTVSDIHDLLLEWNLPRIQFNHLRDRAGGGKVVVKTFSNTCSCSVEMHIHVHA